MGLMASLPFVGKAVGQQVMANINHPGMPKTGGLASGRYPTDCLTSNKLRQPYMEMQDAWKRLFKNKEMIDEYTSDLYQKCRVVDRIDPDLDVYKSFSKMAKITFQRQRIVQQAVESNIKNQNDYGIPDKVQNYLQKLMWG